MGLIRRLRCNHHFWTPHLWFFHGWSALMVVCNRCGSEIAWSRLPK